MQNCTHPWPSGQELVSARPRVGAVPYQALPLLQFFTHNIRMGKESKGEGEPGNKAKLMLMLSDVLISNCVLFRVGLTLILLCLSSETHSMPWFQNGTVYLAPSMDLEMATGRPTRTHLAKNTSVSNSLGVGTFFSTYSEKGPLHAKW